MAGSAMLIKYVIVLLVTTALSMIPPPPIPLLAWCLASTASLFYVIFMCQHSRIKERYIIAMIEIAAMLYAVCAFIDKYLAHKSQFFSTHYEHIMGYCFLMELGVIIIGMANSAESRRILFVCISHIIGDKRTYRDILCSERVLCTPAPKAFQAL